MPGQEIFALLLDYYAEIHSIFFHFVENVKVDSSFECLKILNFMILAALEYNLNWVEKTSAKVLEKRNSDLY